MSPRKWKIDQLEKIVSESRSIREVIGKLGLIPAGGNYKQLHKYFTLLQIDTSHFLGKGWNVNAVNLIKEKTPINEILTENSNYQSFKLKRRLFQENIKMAACEKCGWARTANDGRVPLELHHKNGVSTDNRIENLEILCPNCHSLEPNYRGRNIGKHI